MEPEDLSPVRLDQCYIGLPWWQVLYSFRSQRLSELGAFDPFYLSAPIGAE